jgi:folate-dependent phosphoribosylglycinamide formyltransferase PurN
LRDLYNFSVVATDNPDSNARHIATEHGLDYLALPVGRFASREHRQAYFEDLSGELAVYGVQAAIYAGLMKISTPDFARRFPGLNTHPADLTVMGDDGLPKYRGMKALPVMRQELGYVASTVHVIDNPVDSGSAIALTDRIVPPMEATDDEAHDLLKKQEHYTFPETLRRLGNSSLRLEDTPAIITRGTGE